jgi:hypothetical protein
MGDGAQPSADFLKDAARLRAEYYRGEAARFRSMVAEIEPLAALRRHLMAREYEQMAARREPPARA